MTEIPFVKLDREYEAIRDEIDAAIADVLESGWYVLGDRVAEFEAEFSSYVGAEYGVGVNSGSDALYLALDALGVGPGDEVITVAHTFVATADAIVRCGATPVFVDVDSKTYTMDVSRLEEAITGQTKAIVPVHLYGHPVEMDPLLELAEKHDLYVVEDAAQAHGATYKGQPVGSIGDVGCFSFYPVKNLGAYGDGGLVVTDNGVIASEIEKLRDLGSSRKYYHGTVGINSRLDELQAAVLGVKLDRLTTWNDRRRLLADRYDSLLDTVKTPTEREWARHVYHLYVVRSDHRDGLREYLDDHGVKTIIHYPIPVHEQDSYTRYKAPNLPSTNRFASEILSLPLSPWHTQREVEQVASLVERYHK